MPRWRDWGRIALHLLGYFTVLYIAWRWAQVYSVDSLPELPPSTLTLVLRAGSLLIAPVAAGVAFGLLFPPLGVDRSKITDAVRKQQVVFLWCTCGNAPNLTIDVTRKAYALLKDSGTNFLLEVVTGKPIRVRDFAPEIPEHLYHEILIPEQWKCPNGSLFKGRALHYAMLHSNGRDDAVVVHLDEESEITADFCDGVRQFMVQRPGKIGQGVIAYRNVGTGWQSYVCHLMDSMRSGQSQSALLEIGD
jgi:hypothetical protein